MQPTSSKADLPYSEDFIHDEWVRPARKIPARFKSELRKKFGPDVSGVSAKELQHMFDGAVENTDQEDREDKDVDIDRLVASIDRANLDNHL